MAGEIAVNTAAQTSAVRPMPSTSSGRSDTMPTPKIAVTNLSRASERCERSGAAQSAVRTGEWNIRGLGRDTPRDRIYRCGDCGASRSLMPFTASSLCIGRSFSSTQRKTRATPAISSNASVTRLFIPLLPGGVTCQIFHKIRRCLAGPYLLARP